MMNSCLFKRKIMKSYQEEFYQYYMRIVLGSKDVVWGETLMRDEDEEVSD